MLVQITMGRFLLLPLGPLSQPFERLRTTGFFIMRYEWYVLTNGIIMWQEKVGSAFMLDEQLH